MDYVVYGLYDEGVLICSIEMPLDNESGDYFDLKSQLNEFCTVDHSLIERVRETSGAAALNRIFG